MDIIDALIFTSANLVTRNDGTGSAINPIIGGSNAPNIYSDILSPLLPNIYPNGAAGVFSYDLGTRESFCILEDTSIIEAAMQKHWFDIVNKRAYTKPGVTPYVDYAISALPDDPDDSKPIPPYHLIYAYLLENTRIAQIFEKLIYLYQTDEKLTKASIPQAFQWIMNTDALFFKDPPSSAIRFYNGYLRPVPEAVRRNAYQRLFGIELAFGDITNNTAKYVKAEFNNSSFILIFESFLREFWKAYVNARNTSGENYTDFFALTDIALKLQELLMSRRYQNNDFNGYKWFNLSREEYGSVMLMSWLFESISYDSPLVEYLRCTGNTPGERLINIGLKVGIAAHSKSEIIFEMAVSLNALLRMVEVGSYNPDQETTVKNIVYADRDSNQYQPILSSILLIINNWERITGHRIKTLETPVTGNVRILNGRSKVLQ
jgi:hypothetical protein